MLPVIITHITNVMLLLNTDKSAHISQGTVRIPEHYVNLQGHQDAYIKTGIQKAPETSCNLI